MLNKKKGITIVEFALALSLMAMIAIYIFSVESFFKTALKGMVDLPDKAIIVESNLPSIPSPPPTILSGPIDP